MLAHNRQTLSATLRKVVLWKNSLNETDNSKTKQQFTEFENHSRQRPLEFQFRAHLIYLVYAGQKYQHGWPTDTASTTRFAEFFLINTLKSIDEIDSHRI